MGRVHRKKFRTHVGGASSAAKAKESKAASDASGAPSMSVVAAAAVSAAFGGDADAKEWAALPSDDEDLEEGDNKALSRGQRKRLKRRTAFMRKMGMVKRVVQEKSEQQKREEHGMLADLKELQASLFVADQEAKQAKTATETKDASQKGKSLSGKQRKKLAVRELKHLKAVHTHPSFQGDPFAAIQMHLKNTVVAANKAVVQAAEQTTKGTKKDNKMDTE